MDGRLGKYISVTNGPNAVNEPNNINKNILEFVFLIILPPKNKTKLPRMYKPINSCF